MNSNSCIDEILKSWDEYQAEIVKKFYGGEPKAKKPLTVYNTPQGSIVVPGLADAHAHLIQYGFKAVLPLDTAQSLDEVLNVLETYVRDHPDTLPSEWISGFGWDQTRWKDWSGEFPTAVRDTSVDKACWFVLMFIAMEQAHLASRDLLAGRPIALSRVDGHALWVSPRALELTREQLPEQRWPSDEEVVGGEIMRDSNGKPTGQSCMY
jgi:predicted amidohydrolase YtcJ